jgi:hypothetical protein
MPEHELGNGSFGHGSYFEKCKNRRLSVPWLLLCFIIFLKRTFTRCGTAIPARPPFSSHRAREPLNVHCGLLQDRLVRAMPQRLQSSHLALKPYLSSAKSVMHQNILMRLTGLLLLFCASAYAQSGTIKIKKNGAGLTFANIQGTIGYDKDSVTAWIKSMGFTEGKLKNRQLMEYCGITKDTIPPVYGMSCAYFVNDTLDIRITCTKENKVYMFLVSGRPRQQRLGEELFLASVKAGYKPQSTYESKAYRWSKKESYSARLSVQVKKWWDFSVSNDLLFPK